ncbi:UAA transporter [Panus rudis PR-1116 ss-1]|nr:UAA transporter [Panus rudis PR-1116 ss-1]
MSLDVGRGISLALLSDWVTTLSLVFGGCCSNALTLEQLVSANPHAGSLITFAQFLCITLKGLPKFITLVPLNTSKSRSCFRIYYPRLKPRQIPIFPYLVQVLLFYFVSLLNNAAFAYRIPMPVHIIFRSGGLVVSMVMGRVVLGRRYNWMQIVSVFLVTAGVVLTTLSASKPRRSPIPQSFVETENFQAETTSHDAYTYATGILILFLALVLSGFLGIVQDRTYALYGNKTSQPDSSTRSSERDSTARDSKCSRKLGVKKAEHSTEKTETWQESMFYLHFLSMPMFWSVRTDLLNQFQALSGGPLVQLQMVVPPALQYNSPTNYLISQVLEWLSSIRVPKTYLILLLNTLTQLFCVSGVHRLTSRVSSLTVTLILVVRKAMSLIISVMLFGIPLEGERRAMMWGGAALVFLGTFFYSLGSAAGMKGDRKVKSE